MHNIESTLIARDGTWKAKIYRRDNGTYGFRALRWDNEETCWVMAMNQPLSHHRPYSALR